MRVMSAVGPLPLTASAAARDVRPAIQDSLIFQVSRTGLSLVGGAWRPAP
jgi:hypothetical protein